MDYHTHIASINVNHINVQSGKKQPKEEPPKEESSCFCHALSPILFTCKLFGFFPISWENQRGQCVYKKSYLWLSYSGVICTLYVVQLFSFHDLLHFDKSKQLPELLSVINDIMYLVFVAILTLLNVARFPRFVKTLNKLIPIIKEAGLGCPSALASSRRVEYGYLILFFGELFVEYGVLIWLHYSERYQTNFDYNIFLNTGIQNIPFVFYMLFFCMCSAFISILACFEKLIIHALKFTPVHPLNDIDETNNKRDFIGLIKYQVCKQEHKCFGKMLQLTQPELIEYLRSLHEDISLAMYDINSCLNPQLLFHTVVELTVLIIHWYEVIIYTSYEFASPYASTINFLNWVFVIAHTAGLFLFLKSAQELKNMVSIIFFLFN